MQRFTAPYMPVCFDETSSSMGPAVRSAACGIMENPGIPAISGNDGVSIPISHDISERPAGPLTAPGEDIECDTIAGKTGKACLVTLVDERAGICRGKATKKTAQAVMRYCFRYCKGNL